LDGAFGFVSWARDLSKVCFIGEATRKAQYQNPWDINEKDKDAKWLHDKYTFEEDFGENNTGKQDAALFVYNLDLNKVDRVHGIPDKVWPQWPVFDEHSKGIVFAGLL
jgi:hypothetical protein